ncbi:MAG: carboxymuconolactone decarboxylase family protein [Nitrospinota bacterium]
MNESTQSPYNPKAFARGIQNYGEVYTRRVLDRLNSIDPEFSELFQSFVYGGLYDREVIDHKTRELCAIAGLTVGGCFPQLRAHFQACRNYGATDEEIREVILQMSVYGGMPAALSALDEFERYRESETPTLGFGDPGD